MSGDAALEPDPGWDRPYPYVLVSLNRPEEWAGLFRRYRRGVAGAEAVATDGQFWDQSCTGTDRPWRRCLEVARENGARSAVVETRYIDADYRSEYSSFYSRAFKSFEDSTHRVHFFQAALSDGDLGQLPHDHGYIGYVIIRPQVSGIVGRTMLRTPPDQRRAVRTGVREQVTFFGQALEIRAVPFMQQDAKLGVCAHVAAWMLHYSAYRGGRGVNRQVIAAFSEAVDPKAGTSRPVPSGGPTLLQVAAMLQSMRLFPIHYEVDRLGANDDRPPSWPAPPPDGYEESTAAALRVVCRYLNSGLPVMAIVRVWMGNQSFSALHAVVVCGYERSRRGDGAFDVIIHDDRRGPYVRVTDLAEDVDPVTGECQKWDHLLATAPEKLWLLGESVEREGSLRVLRGARIARDSGYSAVQRVLDAFESGELAVRVYAIEASRYKRRIRARYTDPVVIMEYSFARFPKFIWVVEIVDSAAREQARGIDADPQEVPCVLGEIIYDATSPDLEPDLLAMRLPGVLSLPKPGDPSSSRECGDQLQKTCGQYEA